MNFKEKISDFQSLMKSCINDMKIEGEENLLNYFRETYCSSFNTEIYTRIDILKRQLNYLTFYIIY